MPKGSALRIGSVVIDCLSFDRMFAFWKEALHFATKRPPEGGWVILRDPDGNLFCVVDTSRR